MTRVSSVLAMVLAVACLIVVVVTPVRAANLIWVGLANDGGVFASAANWDPAQSPTTADNVTIARGDRVDVSAGNIVVAQLTVLDVAGRSSSGNANADAELFAPPGNPTPFGATLIAAAGSLKLTNVAFTAHDCALIDVRIASNDGFAVSSGGLCQVWGNVTLTGSEGVQNNGGTIQLVGGASPRSGAHTTLTFDMASFVQTSSGTIVFDNDPLLKIVMRGVVTETNIAGTITMTHAAQQIVSQLQANNVGLVNIHVDATFTGGVTNLNGGCLVVEGNGLLMSTSTSLPPCIRIGVPLDAVSAAEPGIVLVGSGSTTVPLQVGDLELQTNSRLQLPQAPAAGTVMRSLTVVNAGAVGLVRYIGPIDGATALSSVRVSTMKVAIELQVERTVFAIADRLELSARWSLNLQSVVTLDVASNSVLARGADIVTQGDRATLTVNGAVQFRNISGLNGAAAVPNAPGTSNADIRIRPVAACTFSSGFDIGDGVSLTTGCTGFNAYFTASFAAAFATRTSTLNVQDAMPNLQNDCTFSGPGLLALYAPLLNFQQTTTSLPDHLMLVGQHQPAVSPYVTLMTSVTLQSVTIRGGGTLSVRAPVTIVNLIVDAPANDFPSANLENESCGSAVNALTVTNVHAALDVDTSPTQFLAVSGLNVNVQSSCNVSAGISLACGADWIVAQSNTACVFDTRVTGSAADTVQIIRPTSDTSNTQVTFTNNGQTTFATFGQFALRHGGTLVNSATGTLVVQHTLAVAAPGCFTRNGQEVLAPGASINYIASACGGNNPTATAAASSSSTGGGSTNPTASSSSSSTATSAATSSTMGSTGMSTLVSTATAIALTAASSSSVIFSSTAAVPHASSTGAAGAFSSSSTAPNGASARAVVSAAALAAVVLATATAIVLA